MGYLFGPPAIRTLGMVARSPSPMPTRRVSLVLLLFWTYAAWTLFRRDILPDLIVGPPPDLRSIASGLAGDSEKVKWAVLVVEERDSGEFNGRAVGQVVTETSRQRDGGVRLVGNAWFDTSQLFTQAGRDPADAAQVGGRPTPLGSAGGERLEILSNCWVDRFGNLESFRVSLREGRTPSVELLMLEGRLRNDRIEIKADGIVPYFGPKSFPYKAHGMVQSTFSPLGRMPRLHVGQSWESQVVNPLTGQVEETGRVEVVGTKVITWDSNPVTTLEVVTRALGLTARTWVRRDGLVLRQEVPLPFVNLVLERIPGDVQSASEGGRRP